MRPETAAGGPRSADMNNQPIEIPPQPGRREVPDDMPPPTGPEIPPPPIELPPAPVPGTPPDTPQPPQIV